MAVGVVDFKKLKLTKNKRPPDAHDKVVPTEKDLFSGSQKRQFVVFFVKKVHKVKIVFWQARCLMKKNQKNLNKKKLVSAVSRSDTVQKRVKHLHSLSIVDVNIGL